MKVVVEYNAETGEIKDAVGMYVGSFFGLESFEIPKESNVRDLIKLKEAGFTAEDLVQMKEGGLL